MSFGVIFFGGLNKHRSVMSKAPMAIRQKEIPTAGTSGTKRAKMGEVLMARRAVKSKNGICAGMAGMSFSILSIEYHGFFFCGAVCFLF